MRELRWYLEHFLDYPFHPETGHADHVLDALKAWGARAFNALFDRRDASAWLATSGILQIRSNDPVILSWPWEALFDPQTSYLAHQRPIERRLNHLADPPPLANLRVKPFLRLDVFEFRHGLLEERDFTAAREWYLKSLAIEEKQGNLHGAASTYGQLGILAACEGDFIESGGWLTRSIRAFLQGNDRHQVERSIRNFLLFHRHAAPEDKQKLEAIWHEAGLGDLPAQTDS